MNQFKRIVSLVLTLAILVTVVPVQAFGQRSDETHATESTETVGEGTVVPATHENDAEGQMPESSSPTNDSVDKEVTETALLATSGTLSGDQSWSFDESSGVLTIRGTGAMQNYSGYSNVPWGNLRDSVTSVDIEDGITNIPSYAFYYFGNLENIRIPASVTTIGNYAFQYCEFTAFDIPDTVTSLGSGVFAGCKNLISISIPEGVSAISISLFEGCSSLQEVNIPDTVTYVGKNGFSSCYALKTIDLPEKMTSLGDYAFYYSGLTEIHLPASITSIGENTFAYCLELAEITMPGVQTLPYRVFYHCSSLKRIMIPGSMKKISNDVFTGSAVQEIHVEDLNSFCTNTVCYSTSGGGTNSTVTYSSNDVFTSGRQLYYNGELVTDLVIPEGTSKILPCAFAGCTHLTSVSVPKSVKTIGQGAFSGCTRITRVELETGIQTIDKNAFSSCINLTDLQLPGSGIIKASAFAGCDSLREVTIPNGVTSLGLNSFSCSNLEKITLAGTVGTLSEKINYSSDYAGAFRCPNLKELHLENLSVWCSTNFGNQGIRCTDADLYVNGELVKELEIPENVSSIGSGAFSGFNITGIVGHGNLVSVGNDAFMNCKNLQSIRNADKVTAIGQQAFMNCPKLETVDILGSATELGIDAFADCVSLKSVQIPKTLTTIGARAFSGCTGLTDVKLEDGLTRIGDYMFMGCTKLTSLSIPNSVTYIGSYAFEGCTGLMKIRFPVNRPSFGSWVLSGTGFTYVEIPGTADGMLNGCESLQSATIQSGAPGIAYYCFAECTNLREVYIPLSVKIIEQAAFKDCGNLTDIYYGGSAEDWAAITIEEDNDVLQNVTVHFASKGFLLGSGSCGKNMTWEYYSGGDLIFYGSGAMYDYTVEDLPWGEFTDYICAVKMADKITSISAYAFANCIRLQQARLSRSLTEIPVSAFQNCVSLEKVTMFKGLRSIGQLAFCACDSLAIIDIPETVTEIGNFAFAQCTALASLRIPDGVTQIGNNCFRECTGLKNVILSAGLRKIGTEVFGGCTEFEAVFFLGDAPEFAGGTFYGNEIIAYYPQNNESWTEDVRQNYGGTVGWISYDPKTTDVSSDAQILQKMAESILIITPRPASQYHNEAARNTVMKLGVDLFSVLGVTAAIDGKFYISQSDAKKQDIKLTKDGYQTYVIPAAVSESLMPVYSNTDNSALRFPCELDAYMSLDKKDGKPYISTVFARPSGAGAPYQDVRFQELKMYEDTTFDIIVSAMDLGSSGVTYYIGQSESKRISSQNGVFSGEDLFGVFEEGKPVYAYLVCANGTATEPLQIKLTKMTEKDNSLSEFLSSSTISIFGKDGQGLTIPEDVWCIGGMKINTEIFTFPAGIEVNGSDIKISLGLDIFRAKQDKPGSKYEKKTLFENYKKDVKKAWEGDGFDSSLEALSLYDMLSTQYDPRVTNLYQKSKNWNVGIMGYLDGTMVNSNIIVKDAYLGINGSFNIKYTQQGAVGAVPAYFYTSGGAKVDIGTKYLRFVPDSDVPLTSGLILDITPQLRVGGGVGVKDAASAGLWASGSLPIHRDFNRDYTKIKLLLKAGVEAEFFLLKGEKEFPENIDMIVYEAYGSGRKAPLLLAGRATDNAENTEASLVSREYASETSQWLGSQPAASLLEDAVPSVCFRDLQSGVYANSMAQIAPFGNGLIMVWVEDDATRDAYNRMRLVYSIYDRVSDTWSEIQPVCDDGRNDGYPNLISDGETAYVVWQKIDTLMTADNSTYDTLLENSELYLATIETKTGTVTGAEKITDNDQYEYNAVVKVEDGEPVVYHASVDGSKIGDSGNHCIMRRRERDGWSDFYLVDHLNYVITLDAADGNVSYCVDTDGLDATTNDISIYTYNDANNYSAMFDKAGNETAYSVAVYGDMNGIKTLFVSDMQNIYYMDGDQPRAVFDMNRSISGNINAITTDSGLMLLWTEYVADRTELFAVSYADGSWSKPVQISDQDKVLYGVDVTVFNGKPVGVCNATALQYGSPTGEPTLGGTNLCAFTAEAFTDLSLSETAIFDESGLTPGSEHTFHVIVTNNGTQTVDTAEFTITDTLGTDCTVTKTLDLMSGDSAVIALEYPVPENYAVGTLQVTARVPGATEANNEDNTATASIGKSNLFITDAAIYSFDDGYIIKAVVNNGSAVNAENVKLAVTVGEENAEPLLVRQIGNLDRESYVSADITIGMDQLVFDEYDAAKVYLKVACDGEDAVEGDNIACVVLTKPIDVPCAHPDLETVEGYDPSCEGTGLTDGVRCYDCGIFLMPQEEIPALDHDWQDANCSQPKTCAKCGTEEGEPLPHSFTNYESNNDATCTKDGTKTAECDAVNCSEKNTVTDVGSMKPHFDSEVDKDHLCDVCGKTINECTDGNSDFVCDICGRNLPKPDPDPTEPDVTEPDATEPEVKVEGVTRLAGENRLVTSELIANQLKEKMGVEKFENIIVASGGTFADALPGSYLAAVKNAPIVLTLAKQKYIDQTANYIKANLAAGGTVYILGGESAVPSSMETALTGIDVKRVAGADRFGTNLAILKEAGVKSGDEILVCTAKEFADSLSAAATGKPILLVYKKITDEQKTYLGTLSGNAFCVVGGTTAVPNNIIAEICNYGSVSRLAGKDRLDTSILVAQKYFPNATSSVVAYGWDFPDGLCGGSLAYATKSPLILAHSKEKLVAFTAEYTEKSGLNSGYVLGGEGLISNDAAQKLFCVGPDEITVLK